MISKRSVLVILSLLMLMVMVSPLWAAEEKTKVTYWTWLSNQDLVDEFNKSHPNIQVEFIKMGSYDAQNKFLVALSSGTGAPDVIQIMLRQFSLFTNSGKLVEMTDYVKDIKSQYARDLIEVVSYKSKIYGLPVNTSPAVIWYRRDVFKKYNIPVPVATWNDFVKAGEVLKKNGIFIMPLFNPAGSWGANAVVMFLQSRGGNIYTAKGKLIRNNKELEYVLQWVNNFNKNKLTDSITFFTPEFYGSLKTQFACWPMNVAEGANIKRYLPDMSGQWGVMPFPKWNDKKEQLTGYWGGTILTVPKQSKVKEAALTFVKWVAGTVPGQVAAGKSAFAVPAYRPALKDDFYTQGDPYFGNDNFYKMINPVKPIYYFDWAVTERVIGKHMDLMFAGKESPQQARAAIENELADETNR